MQISPLGGWIVFVLPIPIGGEWFKPSTDFNLNHKHKNIAPKLTSFMATSSHLQQATLKQKMYIPCVLYLYQLSHVK